jgi:predicted RNase H-like HicB family nuclease
MHRYLIVVEKATDNYSAYAPDVPGCAATGDTQEEAERNLREALELHLQDRSLTASRSPNPQTTADYVTLP